MEGGEFHRDRDAHAAGDRGHGVDHLEGDAFGGQLGVGVKGAGNRLGGPSVEGEVLSFLRSSEVTHSASEASSVPAHVPSRWRWGIGLGVGTLLWGLAVGVAHSFPVLAAAGFTLERARADALIGAGVAVAWAALQFGVLIPLTGGGERADVVVNAQQIGTTYAGLAAFVLLAWGGGFAEEVFFRAHLMTSLRGMLGHSKMASALVVLVPTLLFALLHGYQGGWVGMLDTGAFGGLTLSLIFLLRGRLLACVVAHALWNTIATVVIFRWY